MRTSAHPRGFGLNLMRSATLAAAVAAADLAAKWFAERHLDEPISLPAGLRLELGHNSGVAFGALDAAPDWTIAGATALLVAGLLVAAQRGLLPLSPSGTGLLVGGGVANLIDRLGDGRVTDFIDPPRWPAFNLADVAITLGVLLILWRSVREDRPSGTAAGLADA